jgi:hypothetical protein
VADLTYIRDQIVINDVLKARIDKLPPGSTIRLVAQQIRHDPGYALLMPGYHMVIVAGEYDNNGGSINVSGGPGKQPGAPGDDGAPGIANSEGIGNRPGGTGNPGGRGQGGTAATSVRITCELLRAGELQLFANGGAGSAGGAGGAGGKGGNGRIVRRPIDPIIIEGTSGGSGGSGGPGGAGGSGGQVLVAHIGALIFAPPVLEAAGGRGGSGGPGGRRGAKGALSEEDNGRPGPAGAPGPSGAAGTVTNSQISADAYLAHVLAELGPAAAEWAAYRLAVGEYHYRAYNPEDPSRAGFLIRAMREFDAVLRLDPTNAQAARLQQQILLDQNIIGLPNKLDLIPAFEQYITAFLGFGDLVFGVFNLGVQEMLQANTVESIGRLLDIQRGVIANAVTDTEVELHDAIVAQKDADDEVNEAKARVAEANNQIQAALEEMKNHSFSIEGLVGIVAEIGGAVVAVAAILPSGGTSVLALIPDLVALGESVSANAGPIVDALFRIEAPDLKNVTDAYKKVNKDVDEVVKDTKLLINFVNLIHKLAAGSTPDNSKYVALVQRGAELIHAQLLAEHRKGQADHTVEAVGAKLERGKALLAKTEELLGHLSNDVRVFRDAGLSAVRNAQIHVDSVLSFAFRAERSVEIYTLKSEVKNLFLDTGYVHPDIERDYAEIHLIPAELIAAYSQSWARLLQPVKMQADYLAYFSDQNNLDDDSRRLSFTDPDLLQNFRDMHDLQFTLDFDDLPAAHSDAKIQGVFVAFVGATSASGVISCEVRHGNRYEQRRPDGSVVVQLLQPRTDTQLARTTRLELAGVGFESAPPLTAPQSLSFWGRGVVGLWGLSIPQSEFDLDPPDLTELSEIQVWVGYQFLR